MASQPQQLAQPALEGYGLLKAHAAHCDACLGDAVLAVVSLTVTGEVRFPLELCPRGEQLLAALADDMWPNPCGLPLTSDGGSATQAPRETGPSSLIIQTPKEAKN